MRKVFIIIVVLFMLFIFKTHNETSSIRVRIIPKDNQYESLVIKEKVKSITIDFLKSQYDKDYKNYKKNILNNINIYNNKVIEYNANAELCYHTFYDKTYNGNSLKNQTVLTFLVQIEEAKGDNWWGTIYPEFLDMNSTKKVEYEWFIIKKIKEWFR